MIIAFVSRKGGVGKTTSAVSLAAAFARRGRRTLVVDLDPQASASRALGVERALLAPSIADVLLQNLPMQAAIRPTRSPHLDLVTSSVDMGSADEALQPLRNRERVLQGKLAPVRDLYDHILLDCPPSLANVPANAIVAADAYVVPAVPQFLAVEGVENLMSAVQRLCFRTGARTRLLGILLTMVDYRIKSTAQIATELRRAYGDRVFATEIRVNCRLAEAPGAGQTIFEYDAASRGAGAYQLLATEIVHELAYDPMAQPEGVPENAGAVSELTSLTA